MGVLTLGGLRARAAVAAALASLVMGVPLAHAIDPPASPAELEAFLEELQPGWRDLVVHRRFLPSLAVTNALTIPSAYRPQPQTPVRGLYLAGDWVGGDGVMADAALTSARAAARAILAEA